MNRYMLMHFGFEPPTPEIMQKWKQWFERHGSITEENGGFRAAREIDANGSHDLPMGPDSITGYTLIKAESMAAAEAIAAENPFIASIRIYEVMTHG